jgi:hypothetical protein
MSVTLTLIPLAVALSASLTAASVAMLANQPKNTAAELPVLETAFNDLDLLHKTLTQHGLQVQRTEDGQLIVRSESGTLHYFRAAQDAPFSLRVSDVTNMPELLSNLDELENEYGRNVQTFTYHKVMTGLLEHGMTIDSEEILEDDSILLTLNL